MDEAFASREQLLALHVRSGDRLREGDTRRWLSRLAWFRADHETAVREAGTAVDVLADLPAGRELAMAYSNMAQLRMLASDVAGARAWGAVPEAVSPEDPSETEDFLSPIPRCDIARVATRVEPWSTRSAQEITT